MNHEKRVDDNEKKGNSSIIPINFLYNEFKYICKIEINIDKNIIQFGSGFFIKLEKDNKPLYCLMSNEHIISRDIINKNGKISIIYNNEEEITQINLTKDRFIKDYKDIGIDATIVKILNKDNINKDFFLSPKYYDINYNYKELENKNIYIPQFPKGKNLHLSEGKLKKINQNYFEFSHLANTQKGSSGSPILIYGTSDIIGIHIGYENDPNKNNKIGCFIWPIILTLKKNIKIIDINKNRYYYIGETINGVPNGKVKIFDKNNYHLIFDGHFKNGKSEGEGTKYNEEGDIIYYGNYLNGNVDGQGIYYFKNGQYYIGEFKNGVKHGKGIYFTKDHQKELEGYFQNDKYAGPDKYIYENGDYFIGELINGLPSLKGKIYNKNEKLKYEGDLVNGIPEGKGMSFYENGTILYIGDFVNGKPEGLGEKYDRNNKLKYEGDWLNGLRHGKGKEYDENGNKIQEGFFIEDTFIGDIQ